MPKSLINDRFGNELNIVVIGPPFSFKGQIGKFLSSIYGINDKEKDIRDGFYTVCVGDEFRKKAESETKLVTVMGQGNLGSDDIAHDLAMQRYNQGKSEGYRRFYIDGHCRTAGQVAMLKQAGILGEHSLCYIFNATRVSCFERLDYALENGDRDNRLDNKQLEKRIKTYNDNIPGVLQALLDHRIDHEHINADGGLGDFEERFLKKLTPFCTLPKAPHQEQVKRPQWVYGEPRTPMFA